MTLREKLDFLEKPYCPKKQLKVSHSERTQSQVIRKKVVEIEWMPELKEVETENLVEIDSAVGTETEAREETVEIGTAEEIEIAVEIEAVETLETIGTVIVPALTETVTEIEIAEVGMRGVVKNETTGVMAMFETIEDLEIEMTVLREESQMIAALVTTLQMISILVLVEMTTNKLYSFF